MLSPLSAAQRRALGDFLRAQRARLMPASLGLPDGRRRRTPGLRREEVAEQSGISATWYSWIEQGRDVSVSPLALARLARALLLSAAERAYLFELAGKRDPSPDPGDAMEAPPALVAALGAIVLPAYVLDRAWNASAWNPPAEHLFVGWLDSGERNLLRYIFLAPEARRLIPDWRERGRRVVAEFRADTSRHLDDPELRALVEDLRRRSTLFAELWSEHGVVSREGGERRFQHPKDGLLRYEQITFTLAGRPDFKLVVLVKV